MSSPSGVWGRAPAEIEFGAFYSLKILISGGNNFNDFADKTTTVTLRVSIKREPTIDLCMKKWGSNNID